MQAKIADLPESVDWRDQGVVTMVRNQGACGSCWAFASASVLGSYAKINDMTHDLIELSPQHLVSCVPNPLKCGGTGGCMGSIEPLAYTYASLFGIVTEDDYPYASGSGGNDDVCEFDATTTDATVMTMGFETLPRNDAAALMSHLATEGPLSASVAASDWSSYHGGVFDGCDYSGNMVVNHAVTLIGYGTDPSEGDFWLVKNSWGSTWGEGGYIRLRRQSTPQCAIDSSPLDGSGCVDGGVESVEVCGTCAVVSDNSYPLGTTFML
jgi:cathepsin L